MKRQKERDSGKRMKVVIEPKRVSLEFNGYQPDEIGRAVGPMAKLAAIGTTDPDRKKAITYKK